MRPWRLESKNRFKLTGAASAEEALLRLLETQEEQDRGLLENKNALIYKKIRRGIDQLDRGEGVPEEEVDDYLAKLKAQPE